MKIRVVKWDRYCLGRYKLYCSAHIQGKMGDVDKDDAGSDFGDDLQYDFVTQNLYAGKRNDSPDNNEENLLPVDEQVTQFKRF